MNKNIITVCKNILFNNDCLITPLDFQYEFRKYDIVCTDIVIERLVAFLSRLPRNIALFHAY